MQSLTRPDAANAHKTVDWYYRKNGWMNHGTTFIPMDTTVGDLSKFDAQAVLGVLGGAPQSLQITNPTSNYLIIDSGTDGSLDLQIHLSDGTDSGYIELAGDGTVKRISPRAPDPTEPALPTRPHPRAPVTAMMGGAVNRPTICLSQRNRSRYQG